MSAATADGSRDARPLVRVYARTGAHRFVPRQVAMILAAVVGRAWWRYSPAKRQHAEEWAEAMALDGSPPAEQKRLARLALVEHAMREELFWRPWHQRRRKILGIEHLRTARESGRGTIILTAHLGTMSGIWIALASQGIPLHVPRTSAKRRSEGPLSYADRRRASLIDQLAEAGAVALGKGGAYSQLGAALAGGGACLLPLDVPGGMPTTLYGHPASVASGPAALAFETGALIVPCFTRRRGLHEEVVALRPLDPREHASQAQLLLWLAAVVDSFVRDHLPKLYPSMPPTPERHAAHRSKLELREAKAVARGKSKPAAESREDAPSEEVLDRRLVEEMERARRQAAPR